MTISLQINGSPTELQQVLSAIGTISTPEHVQPEVTQPVDEPKKNIFTEKLDKPAPAKKTKAEQAKAEQVETEEVKGAEEAKPEPEVAKPAQDPVKRIDLEAIRKEFGPRYMATEKKATVTALLKEFGHEKLGPFYEAATEEQKAEFYNKLIAI